MKEKLEIGGTIKALYSYSPQGKGIGYCDAEVIAKATINGSDQDGFKGNNNLVVINDREVESYGLAFASNNQYLTNQSAIWTDCSKISLATALRELADNLEGVK